MESNLTRPQSIETPRRPWTAPELRRLLASEAELAAAGSPDSEGSS